MVFMYHVTCNVHHNNMCLWIWTETSIQGEYNGNTRVRMRKRFYGMTSSWSGWWVTMVTALYCGATCCKIPGGRSGLPLIHCWQIKNASLGFASPIEWPLCSPKQHKNHKNSIHLIYWKWYVMADLATLQITFVDFFVEWYCIHGIYL